MSAEGPEQNKMEQMPEVTLHFMRHSLAVKEPPAGGEDKDRILTEPGRDLASKKFEKPMNIRYGHIEGSERERTYGTAAIAATQNPETNPEDLGIGKIRIKDELDYNLDEKTPYGAKFYEVFNAGTALPWLIHESDKLAKEMGDTNQSTYSRMAGNVASLIYTTYLVASRGAKILEQSKNADNATNNFERILASHDTILGSFLLKLAEKTRGVSARDELLSIIGKGFDVTEGFDVKLSKEAREEKIRVIYKKRGYTFDEIVPVTILEQMIAEGEE